MTIELTRRWFLFGSAAAVATAAIGIKTKTPFVPVILAPTPSIQTYRSRLISSIQLYPTSHEDFYPLRFTFWLGNRRTKNFVIGNRNWLHWGAIDDLDKLLLLSSEALRIELESETGLGRAEVYCEDEVDDGPRVRLLEIHSWPSKGPAEILYLEPDNSLEARLRREEERKNVPQEPDEEYEPNFVENTSWWEEP